MLCFVKSEVAALSALWVISGHCAATLNAEGATLR